MYKLVAVLVISFFVVSCEDAAKQGSGDPKTSVEKIDTDNDGFEDIHDAFPTDPKEWWDTDSDGIGNNADSDDDNDGVIDEDDRFPFDGTEWFDFDNDTIGDNKDDDIDGDGILNEEDDYVYYSSELNPCATPEGIVLDSIESTVDWINAMPRPVTLACFLESLPRPILINGTRNSISAQPAIGARSPRIFINIYQTKLLLSVVPDQDLDPKLTPEEERHPLELSVLTSDKRSVKGELYFPIIEKLEYGTPYDHIRFSGGTVCSSCHDQETSVGFFGEVEYFESQALRPYAEAAVSISAMVDEKTACVPEDEPFRCSIFSSILDYGSVFWYNFPVEMDEFR